MRMRWLPWTILTLLLVVPVDALAFDLVRSDEATISTGSRRTTGRDPH
jgi:hypothetical protein